MSDDRPPIGVIGTGYVGLVTAAGFAHLGSDVYCIDIDADKVARLQAGEIPIYEPGLAEMVEACRGRLHFSTQIVDALEHARLLFIAVGTPPTYSGDADLTRRARCRRRDPRVGPARARHEVDGAGGHRCGDQADPRRTGKTGPRVRLMPGVPQGGLRRQGLPEPRPRRDRRRLGLGRRRGRRALRAARRAARADRHRLGGDGQARLERVSRHEDLVHQRDRERLRGDARRRRRGRPRDGARRPHRQEVPAGRDRIRWKLLRRRGVAARAARGGERRW